MKIQKENREKIFSYDKTVLAYEKQIEHNEQIKETLNKSLQEKDREQEELKKELRQEFDQTTQALYAQKEHQIESLQNLKNSSVNKNFHENEDWKPSTEDWEELFHLLNAIYPSYAQKLQEASHKYQKQMERL